MKFSRPMTGCGKIFSPNARLLRKPWQRAVLIVVAWAAAISILVRSAQQNPAINFLPRDRKAEWIVFPTAVDAHAHWFASLDATFRREFVLPGQPRTARLSVRAMRRAELKINGRPVQLARNGNWKNVATIDVAKELRAGANVIEARVFNHNGPPALWLFLDADGSSLRSDQTWEASFAGSSWRPALLATEAKKAGLGNSLAGGEHTLDALKKVWPFWSVFFGIACATAFAWRVVFKNSVSQRWQIVFLAILGCLWLLLIWNNNRWLPFYRGFDSKEHLSYISYIQQHRALPLPTEGWEMYQPPLYYLLAAVCLSLTHLSANDPTSVFILRWVGAFLGIAQFIFVFLTLRLLLPIRAALMGLLFAGFLPMHLYIAHYVTNEILVAALATVTLYLCVRWLKNESPRAMGLVWIGLALGAAMLTKATAILLLPIVAAAIAGKSIIERAPIVRWLGNLTLLLAVCLSVCGWHYVRIWLKFGAPLVGNWDVLSGFTWWQEPGYRTAVDYFRFGRALVAPLFSGLAGVPNGIYSTLWGDGLCGGASSPDIPWRESLTVAGYLCALIPTALVIAGIFAALAQFIRKPSAALFLLLGFFAAIVMGFALMTLKIPSYAEAKAFYGLSALTPLCFFGALGWNRLTERHRNARLILGTFMFLWATNSFAAHWIVPSAAQHLYAAKVLGTQDQIAQASAEAAKAVEADPSNPAARGFYALTLSELGRDKEAIEEAQRAVELSPVDSVAHLRLAIALKRVDLERAIAEARRAIALGSENVQAYQFLMACLLESRRYDEATQLGRTWLTLSPYDSSAHSSLSAALAQTGDLISAARHLGYVIMLGQQGDQAHGVLRRILLTLAKESDAAQRLRDVAAIAPDSPTMLDELAWILATHPAPEARDGTEAVRLAERACRLTERKIPALLDTLAAAYAETGNFSGAIEIAEEARRRARAAGDDDAVKLSDKIIVSLRQQLPIRQEPE